MDEAVKWVLFAIALVVGGVLHYLTRKYGHP